VELGIFGGTFFAGSFYLSAWPLYRLQGRISRQVGPELIRLRQYILAVVAASAVGIFSLSRVYFTPTYMVLGLAAAYLSLPALKNLPEVPRASPKLVVRLIAIGFVTLLFLYCWVKLFAR
jgi:hypothetical protein